MKITFDGNPKQMELLAAMGSKNKLVAAEAQEIFAAFLGPVVQEVLLSEGTSNLIYNTVTFNEDDSPSFPMDLFRGEGEDFVTVWSQELDGGLQTSEVTGSGEFKLTTLRLDTAISLNKKWARKSRLDVVSKAINRMTNTLLVKQEGYAWVVLLKALAEASTNGAGHVITSATQNSFVPADISTLLTKIRRFNTSYSRNTASGNFKLTDLFVSPEIKGQVRGFAYNPVNTVGSQSTGPIAVPEGTRQAIYNSAGAEEIFGVKLLDLVELGVNAKYNELFQTVAVGNIAHSSQAFDATDDELLIGLDLTNRDGFVRGVARDADYGPSITVNVDDQWVTREGKMGWYTGVDEGHVVLDPRPIVGLVV